MDCTDVERARDTAHSNASDFLVRAELAERLLRDAHTQSNAVRHIFLIVSGVLLVVAAIIAVPVILAHLHGGQTPLPT